ncbi:MAG: TraR/DksA C4-type zinc finger protein [Gammaproteobacteria bacterium]|nr:TraR/DksA C4-type zinc finger protein [Gammaproteobacteria bacterium]
MTDRFDIAQERDQLHRDAALAHYQASRPKTQGESRADCAECGEPIPEARRIAVKGCALCRDCQEDAERAQAR